MRPCPRYLRLFASSRPCRHRDRRPRHAPLGGIRPGRGSPRLVSTRVSSSTRRGCAHHAHALAVAPVQLSALRFELELLRRERAALGNDRRAILPVEVDALDGAVVQLGITHVGPVDVSACDIDRDAVGESATGDETVRSEPSGFSDSTRLPPRSRTNRRPCSAGPRGTSCCCRLCLCHVVSPDLVHCA